MTQPLIHLLVNFIFYYGTTFFKNSGIKNGFLISVATSVVNVFMTLPGIYGVERFGRRSLLLFGAAGMCICEFIVAIVGVTISTENLAGQRVLIAFVCIYIVRFLFLAVSGGVADLPHRPSSLLHGVPSPGSLLVKFSLCKFVRRQCRSRLPATGEYSQFPIEGQQRFTYVVGCGISPSHMLVGPLLIFDVSDR